MKFGLYVHIPHCLQICSYCDFAKYQIDSILPTSQYVEILTQEIQYRNGLVPPRHLSSIAFGGGTPSLLQIKDFETLLQALAKAGFQIDSQTEMSLEINPGTLSESAVQSLVDMGFRRFSVGVQSFSDLMLRVGGRKHNVRDTFETLDMLKRFNISISFDLLFAMPQQTPQMLETDLKIALSYQPDHISPYYLTVGKNHPLQKGRAPEAEQLEMFDLVESRLTEAGLQRYELSNYAKPGRESKHNLLYWTDESYWGLGLSAHSYLREAGPWGTRFWNAASLETYQTQRKDFAPTLGAWPKTQIEHLEMHQSLTDFCHTSLRLMTGLNLNALQKKFGPQVAELIESRMNSLQAKALVENVDKNWRLSRQGRLLSNFVFAELTFLRSEIRQIEAV